MLQVEMVGRAHVHGIELGVGGGFLIRTIGSAAKISQ
jgi:hypothetical protein